MKLYFAPLEGITGYIYRNAYFDYFGKGVEKYFTPFLGVCQNGLSKSKIRQDVDPLHNCKMTIVPQLLGNQGTMTSSYVNWLAELGYHEVNLNLGCPYPTVVTKEKGAGMLANTDFLQKYLDDVFSGVIPTDKVAISIKTRIGMKEADEFERILEIYNQFPISELIVHPRVREDFYKGKPCWDSFALAQKISRAPICYNGDIFTLSDYQIFASQFPGCQRIMLGRGPLSNPGLFAEILTGQKIRKEQLQAFHNRLYEDYSMVMSGDRNTLFKMKELWNYMQFSFENCDKYMKKIRKAQRTAEYETAVKELFANCKLKDGAGFEGV